MSSMTIFRHCGRIWDKCQAWPSTDSRTEVETKRQTQTYPKLVEEDETNDKQEHLQTHKTKQNTLSYCTPIAGFIDKVTVAKEIEKKWPWYRPTIWLLPFSFRHFEELVRLFCFWTLWPLVQFIVTDSQSAFPDIHGPEVVCPPTCSKSLYYKSVH